MEITPDKKKLSLLVDKAYEGSLCLPNFQRDFEWSADAVAEIGVNVEVVRGAFCDFQKYLYEESVGAA